MGDLMRLLPFNELLRRIGEEYQQSGAIFDLPQQSWYRKRDRRTISLFGEKCETPLGPAAGPHTQLAQNIVTSYLAGGRFFELKTVQILDALEIDKPCIDAADEGYNTEWSTELTLEEAWEEYAKAWVLLHLLETIFDLKATEATRSFIFNLSVGYDLKGIKSERVQRYIARMKDSSEEPKFREWVTVARAFSAELDALGLGDRKGAVEALEVSGEICRSMTLSTMHGCPPAEIESISEHMLLEQGLDTFVKLNPTLLGYDFVRETLDGLGFDYVTLSRDSFDHDLQYPDALEILTRLRALAAKEGRGFGVKLSNTLPTVNDQGVLPGDEMYLSGRNLFPLTINLAAKLSDAFGGDLPISYSGGITAHNVAEVFETGIRPITLATDLLKPGGYQRQLQLLEELEAVPEWERPGVDLSRLSEFAAAARSAASASKPFRGREEVHTSGSLPLFDCYVAPCVTACPIGQHVPEYIRLVSEERYADALELIYERNALPSITGHICDHQCQDVCTRLDYEGCLNIREVKKLAVLQGMEEYRGRLKERGLLAGARRSDGAAVAAAGSATAASGAGEPGRRVAIIGAGPAGLSAAYFLAREGFSVTVMDREADAGGVVKHVVPHFRISREAIESDIDMIRDMGVEFRFGIDGELDLPRLKEEGYDRILLALGTYRSRPLSLKGDNERVIPAYPFLIDFNRSPEKLDLGKRVAIVGAGDTAMDCARAALRSPGVEEVTVVYRRSEAQMPANAEEYALAKEDNIPFHWLRNPERFDSDGTLTLRVMELGEPDDSGRRRPVATDRTETMTVDTVVQSIGDDPEFELLAEAGLSPDPKRRLVPTGPAGETEVEGVYLIGDSRTGASTIVNCIAEGRRAADAVCREVDPDWGREERIPALDEEKRRREIQEKRGKIIAKPDERSDYELRRFAETEGERCLECDFVCNKCVDVCPNRANIVFPLGKGGYQIVHLDAYCNECGNCGRFCPWEGRPYIDKPTIFSTLEDFEASENPGWLVRDGKVRIRLGGEVREESLVDDALIFADATGAGSAAVEPTGAGAGPAGGEPGGPSGFGAARGSGAARGRATAAGEENRFRELFNELYDRRRHLFGPVEETSRKPRAAAESGE